MSELKIKNWNEKELKRLRKMKLRSVKNEEAKDWKDYLLKLAGIRK